MLQLFRKNLSIQGGQVIIDGATQPGGRPGAEGPKIMVDTNDYSFEVRVPNNEIRNLGFQGGGTIILYEGGNLIENVWMGLSNNGQQLLFRTPGQPNRMAGGGIFIRSNDNILRNNVIAGAFAKAIDIQSGRQNNLIENNLIGTRSDGAVPASFACSGGVFDPGGWYGGWGIALSGSNNRVIGNRIAGLDTVGVKTVTVTVSNGLSSVTAGREIAVEAAEIEDPKEPGDDARRIYLPAVLR